MDKKCSTHGKNKLKQPLMLNTLPALNVEVSTEAFDVNSNAVPAPSLDEDSSMVPPVDSTAEEDWFQSVVCGFVINFS
jgi:hypothetical protein